MKLSPAQLKALQDKGLVTSNGRKPLQRAKGPRTPPFNKGFSTLTPEQKLFDQLCLSHGITPPDHEYPFAKCIGRKWRFDYLFDGWLAVERTGGVWIKGHHSGGQDQIDDMEKQNNAVILGYAVLEFTPEQFDDGSAFAFIKQALDAYSEIP